MGICRGWGVVVGVFRYYGVLFGSVHYCTRSMVLRSSDIHFEYIGFR